jgi:hypothetical protein
VNDAEEDVRPHEPDGEEDAYRGDRSGDGADPRSTREVATLEVPRQSAADHGGQREEG